MIPIKMPEWTTSIRSLVTLEISTTLCYMAIKGRIEPKDFMLIASLVFNFYFLVKHLQEQIGQK